MDSYVIKLSGKAELPHALEIGHNFRVELEGSITAETISDNDDGSNTHYYKFKPVIVEAITGKGERIHAKDTRSKSQLMRALIRRRWVESNEPVEEEDYYNRRMDELMKQV